MDWGQRIRPKERYTIMTDGMLQARGHGRAGAESRNMTGYPRFARFSLSFALAATLTPAFAQTNAARPAAEPAADRSSSYYNFALAHLYAELAGAYGNRG